MRLRRMTLRRWMEVILFIGLVMGGYAAWLRDQRSSLGWPPDLVMNGLRSFSAPSDR